MDALLWPIFFALGGALGALLAWLAARGRTQTLRAVLDEVRAELARERQRGEQAERQATLAREALTRAKALEAALGRDLEAERNLGREKLAAYQQAEERLREAFKAVAADTLKDNSGEFLKRAEERLKPFQESLQKMHVQVQELEKARAQAYGGLTEQVKSLALSQQQLERETGNLVKALRQPQQRGRWGEVQLRNVLELAGLRAGLDYIEQPSVTAGETRLRPDVVVKLPEGTQIVIDAKAPVEAFLKAYEAVDDEQRATHLGDHLRLVHNHIALLSGREYWSQFASSPEFVVMFLPGESFLSVALEQDPDLIGKAVSQRVILASPLTLIALLQAVAYGWRQKRIEEQVEEVGRLGAEIYDRLGVLAGHFGKVGESLARAARSYNETIGSLERTVLPAARRMKELGVPGKRELLALEPLEESLRDVQAGELRRAAKGE
ncbi:MAG: DNA recombination protein RmuC [Candidatus Lambdaproteobacteria bacterium]|nr:DNA recombination protein RmuC [Candidatus Lambdaproteobacteria bacterium]